MRVILGFDGNDTTKFEQAMGERDIYGGGEDSAFDLYDSIVWELDYGDGVSQHPTKYGTITIRKENT